IGDDALLQGIRSALEDEGFDFIGVHHVLTDLLTKPGALTKRLPDRTAQADIERALAVARANGALDVGQGAVVQQGVVLAVEAVEGTNAMLERCAALARPGPGGVLVKASKPQQDLRLDLPTVGVTTVEK